MRASNYLPSKYFLIVALPLVSVTLVIGLYFLYTTKDERATAEATLATNSDVAAVRARATSIDTDGDGLYDWEETLWGTDPRLADTDGDGTPDGKEVSFGHNPTITGPNDHLVSTLTPTAETTGTFASSGLTMTDSLGRELMGSYIVARQTGTELTPSLQERLVNEAVARTVLTHTPPKIATSSLQLVSGTPEAISAYTDSVLSIFKDTVVRNTTPELALISKYLLNKDESALAQAIESARLLNECATRLQEVAVPESASGMHLTLVNSLMQYAAVVEGMTVTETDPMRSVAAAAQYESTHTAVERAVAAFHHYRKQIK